MSASTRRRDPQKRRLVLEPTPQAWTIIDSLAGEGLYGINASEVAHRLLDEALADVAYSRREHRIKED
jgi:hypothetical protein